MKRRRKVSPFGLVKIINSNAMLRAWFAGLTVEQAYKLAESLGLI